MGKEPTPILRELDAGRIAALRSSDEFFWIDLAVDDDSERDQLRSAFGLSEEAVGALCDFDEAGSPVRRMHVEPELIVFAFWCSGNPAPDALGGAAALELFRVNVCLHGDYLLTVHSAPFDLPGMVAAEGIPPGRSERYTVFIALEGMTSTLIEALAAIEREIASIETDLLDPGSRPDRDVQRVIRSLRSRLTTLRMRIAAERGLFNRVEEEIQHVPALEPDREAYFEKIEGALDRAVDRVDAASSALAHMLDTQLNATTFRLTVVATIFLPLTFLTGFFGMNFGWLVDHIDSAAAFWLLGVGLMTGPLILVLALLRGGEVADRAQRFGQRLIRR